MEILYTKLIRPKVRKNNIKRKSLNEKIKEMKNHKITIISGGAAVGKSTLVSSYLENTKENSIWISLDEGCDDLVAFWNYFIEGIGSYLNNKRLYLDILTSQVDRQEIYNLIRIFLNELLEKEDITIVFDDFHYIKDNFLISTLEYFLNNLSDNIHLILISRQSVPMYLSNMIVAGEVLIIEGEDFKLSIEETKSFIEETLNLKVTSEEEKQIFSVTEGWIGGIQLYTMALKSSGSISKLPESNKYLVDYLSKEIMNSLNQEEKDLLIKTSNLPYFTVELCNKILEKTNCEEIINNLIDKNIMIITIDENLKMYRYHNVLKEYLVKAFIEISLKEQSNIYDKAAKFFIERKELDEALELYIKGKDNEKAIELVEKFGHKLINLKLITLIPNDFLKKSLDLTVFKLFYYYSNFNIEKCEEIFYAIGDEVESESFKYLKIFKILLDDFDVIVENFDIDPSKLDKLNPFTQNMLYLIISIWGNHCGYLNQSLESFNMILKNNKVLNNKYIEIYALLQKATTFEEMGRLSESEQEFKRLEELVVNIESLYLLYFLALSGVYIKRLQLNEAKKLLEEAAKRNDNLKGNKYFKIVDRGIKYNLVELMILDGNSEKGEKLLSGLIDEYRDTELYTYMMALKVNTLSESRISKKEFEEYIKEYESLKGKRDYKTEEKLACCRALYFLEKKDETSDLLDELLSFCRKNGLGYILIEALLFKALIYEKQECDEREIKNILREAIFYSKSENILKPFAIYGKDILPLIKKYLNDDKIQKDEKIFIEKVIGLFNRNKSNEILSERELEVLRELSKGCSNKEIGENLYISLSTVKTHIINIYSKLDVKNRVEAIEEGRERKLI
ncbi:MAG: LuxR C-terminal-related transcriptional regulator [Clostridiaceae bacterium]